MYITINEDTTFLIADELGALPEGRSAAAPRRRIHLDPLPALPGLRSLRLSGLRVGSDRLDVEASSADGVLRLRATHAPDGFVVQTPSSQAASWRSAPGRPGSRRAR